MPPTLNEATVQHLTALAERLDGTSPGLWEEDLEEFNRLAGTRFAIEDFQGISGGEDHEDWVRRVLWKQSIRPVADATRSELAEVIRRADPRSRAGNCEAYMAIFDANVPLPNASNLLFYPPDYDPSTNTYGGGRPIGEYEPSPEQIVDWALASGREEGTASL